MIVLLWLLRGLSPIIFLVGAIYLCIGMDEIETRVYVIGCIAAIIGFIFGIFSWDLGVPPDGFG